MTKNKVISIQYPPQTNVLDIMDTGQL